MLIDIHTHRNESNGGSFTSPCHTKITDKKPLAVYGLHPWHIAQQNYPKQLKDIFSLIQKNQLPLMGEIGLDRAIDTSFDLQKEVFRQQVEFAAKHRFICIIHCVRAYSEILFYRKKFPTAPAWIIHDFNSSLQNAKELIRMGCFLSFGQRILNHKSRSYQCLKNLPDEKHFFLETDAGKEYDIAAIYDKAATIRGLKLSELQKKILDNFHSCFKEYPCLMNG